MTPAERALAALVDRPLRASTATVEVPGGVLVLTADYPSSHEHNKALLTRAADPREVLAAAEQAASDAGLDHVRIDALPAALTGELVALATASGYVASRDVVMVVTSNAAPPTPPGLPPARELGWDQVRDSVLAEWEAELPGNPAVVELTDRRHATARAVDVRHLAADRDGRPASRADLYLGRDADGVVAQVENVVTDRHARGHGLARAVVTAAVRLALENGATCVFLVADADDWPREFYARLGFVPVATYVELLRAPRR